MFQGSVGSTDHITKYIIAYYSMLWDTMVSILPYIAGTGLGLIVQGVRVQAGFEKQTTKEQSYRMGIAYAKPQYS